MKVYRYFILLLIFSSSNFGEALAQKGTNDFEFNFKWGFSRRDQNIFDSKTDTLLVTGIDTIMKFKLHLTKEEKQSIHLEIQKMNFKNYPEKYEYQHPDSEEAFIAQPCPKYFLTVTNNKNSKLVEWNNCIHCKVKDEKHAALMQLDRLIEKIIWSKNPLKDYHPNRVRIDPN